MSASTSTFLLRAVLDATANGHSVMWYKLVLHKSPLNLIQNNLFLQKKKEKSVDNINFERVSILIEIRAFKA